MLVAREGLLRQLQQWCPLPNHQSAMELAVVTMDLNCYIDRQLDGDLEASTLLGGRANRTMLETLSVL